MRIRGQNYAEPLQWNVTLAVIMETDKMIFRVDRKEKKKSNMPCALVQLLHVI